MIKRRITQICVLLGILSVSSVIVHAQNQPEIRARQQYPVPSNGTWTEIPFVDSKPAVAFNSVESQRGYLLFKRPITQAVYPGTKPQWYERLNYISGFASKNEFEPLTFSIYPTRQLQNLKVRISALSCQGNTIPASNIEIRLATYWKLRYPLYTTAFQYRYIPELLEKVNVHTSPAGECQRYWIIIKTTPQTQPGLYTGNITITDDVFTSPVNIPVKFRVLDFELIKDPQKHFTAFNYDLHLEMGKKYNTPEELAWANQAVIKEYQAMKDFGFDMAPVLRIDYDDANDKLILPQNGAAIGKLNNAGITGAVPIYAGMAFDKLYAKHTGRPVQYYPHYIMPEAPPAAFYQDVKRLFQDFETQRINNGWPEFIYCALDEVSSSAVTFGKKCFQAVKEAGCKTYITKRPTASDASEYMPYVDIFCSQPFAVDYAQTQNSNHEYWTYPNHIAGEIKDTDVMCKGGRMTYGYGLWRSGFTTVMPWIWRWSHDSTFIFDYLTNNNYSQTGNQLDEAGDVIPTPYWMCFREGIDDGRYLYTLQTFILERENSQNADCLSAVDKAKTFIQETWDEIKPQQKYQKENMWPDSEFKARRWKIAQLINALKQYPAVLTVTSPSVIAVNSTLPPEVNFIAQQIQLGNVTALDLGSESLKNWQNVTGEGQLTLVDTPKKTGSKALKFQVTVDHATDGGNSSGPYLIGWPRIEYIFPQNTMDMTQYDYLQMWIRVDSNRDEVADDYTYLACTISSWDSSAPRFLLKQEILGSVAQKEWIEVLIPIKTIIKEQGTANENFWKNIMRIEIFISENMYKHGDVLEFVLDDISLIKFNSPVLKSIEVPRYLFASDNLLHIKQLILGEQPSGQRVQLDIWPERLKVLYRDIFELVPNGHIIFDLSLLWGCRKYNMKLSLEGKQDQGIHKFFEVLSNPED